MKALLIAYICRIRNAKITIVSTCMSGSLQELAKNLALSGFGSISVSLLEDRIEGPLIYVKAVES